MTKENKLPHHLICWSCARERGGKCPGGITVHWAECKSCGESKMVSPVTDYVFPKEYGVKHVFD